MYFLYDNINNYTDKQYKSFYNKLNKYDKNKVVSILYDKDKKLSILSRILLINGLRHYYNLDYNNLEFKYNKFNKPYIDNIYFNISHSNEYAVVVFSNNRIAVDIEKIRDVDISIINYFCNYNEKMFILNSKDKYKSLFSIFCLKEAYFKMIGTGIMDFKSLEFKISNGKVILIDNNNLNIILDTSIKGYVISIIEEND